MLDTFHNRSIINLVILAYGRTPRFSCDVLFKYVHKYYVEKNKIVELVK